jgi:hypothetical protein
MSAKLSSDMVIPIVTARMATLQEPVVTVPPFPRTVPRN